MTANPIKVSAQEYALGTLRRHRDSMTRPDFQQIADDSGLYAHEVQALWEKLLAGRAPTPLDRPRAVSSAPSPPVANPAPPAGAVEATPPVSWLRAKDHTSARVRRLYEKATQAVAQLEEALAAEAEKDKLREKEARLIAQLAKVRAELRGGVSVGETRPAGERIVCSGCGKDFAGAHGIVVHRTRTGCAP